MSGSWARKLYIQNAKIYQPVLEKGLERAPGEVRGLIRQFRQFGVPRTGRVLDVSCGIGRHSINLAKQDFTVVGYDPSAHFLSRARQLAAQAKLPEEGIRFCCGEPTDIARILQDNRESGFDAIISMDYSFGYTTQQDDVKLFKALHMLAKPKCLLVIETGNRNFWLKHFQWFWYESFPRKLERFTSFNFNRSKTILKSNWTFYRRLGDHSLKHLLSLEVAARIYSKEALGQLVKSAGWRPLRTFENIEHPRRLTDTSPYFLMLASA